MTIPVEDDREANRRYISLRQVWAWNPGWSFADREVIAHNLERLGVVSFYTTPSNGIITTSDFTSEARKFVEKNPNAILMNGIDLGRNMVTYGIGVADSRTIRITEVDEKVFDTD